MMAAGRAAWLILLALVAGQAALPKPLGEVLRSWEARAHSARPSLRSLLATQGARLASPEVLRFLTSPWLFRLLSGWSFDSPWGRLSLARSGPQGSGFRVQCAPCTVSAPFLSRQPLENLALRLDLLRAGERLHGTALIGHIKLSFTVALDQPALQGEFTLPPTPINDFYALFKEHIPELSTARIQGSLGLQGRFSLADGTLAIEPRIDRFTVTGLGTERLRRGMLTYTGRDANGQPIALRSGEGEPGWLSLPEIGKWLPRATIAAEDARFFRHPGYDLAEVVAALERRAANQERLRGASTLTQQLAKNLFLDSERTLARKLRELLYAVEMEHTLGKRRILELYLNIVDWGSGLYGAKRAAEKYFGIAPADLMPEQAAWLASLLTNPRLALERQQRTGRIDSERVGWILGRMRGLSAAEREQALVRLLEITAP